MVNLARILLPEPDKKLIVTTLSAGSRSGEPLRRLSRSRLSHRRVAAICETRGEAAALDHVLPDTLDCRVQLSISGSPRFLHATLILRVRVRIMIRLLSSSREQSRMSEACC